MRSAIFFLLFTICLAGSAHAYVITINAPGEVRAGAPLEVSGNTTFPVGTQFDLVLYKLQTTVPAEVAKRLIIVGESREFQASFPTGGLEPGSYKVEVRFLTDPGTKISSGSTTLLTFSIIDRSGEIFLTVNTTQTLGSALRIEGYILKMGVSTLTVKISGPSGAVIPPRNVRTTTKLGKEEGYFSEEIRVGEPGNYYVDFYDTRGFIGTLSSRWRNP